MEPEDQSAAINFIDEKFEGAVLKESYPGNHVSMLTSYSEAGTIKGREKTRDQ